MRKYLKVIKPFFIFFILMSIVGCKAKIYEQKVDEQYKIAEEFYYDRNYEAGIKEYQKVINNYPKSYQAQLAQIKIGEGYFMLKKYEEALEAYRKAVKNYPGTTIAADGQVGIGTVYEYGLKDYEKAIEPYKQAMAIYPPKKPKESQSFYYKNKIPFMAIIQHSIAECYYELGNYEQAIKEYQKVIDEYPSMGWYVRASEKRIRELKTK